MAGGRYNKKNQESIVSGDVRPLYNEKYFLDNATGFTEFRTFNGTFETLIDKFKLLITAIKLNKDDQLLDIGCGRGELVIYHALTGGRATGVDFSEDAIKIARNKASELKAKCLFQVSSFEDIDESIKYDKIISADFIEHISVSEARLFFKKCYSLLRPGGILLVYTYPNTIRRRYGYKLIRLSGFLRNRPVPEKEPDTVSDHYKQYHLNEQNYYSLKKLARSAGFSDVRVTYSDMSFKDSPVKSILINTPLRHLFLKGLTLVAAR